MLSNRVRTVLITVITAVWALNFTAPIFEKNYEPPAEINLAFMGVVGILTATFDRKKPPEPPPKPKPRKRTPAKKAIKAVKK